MKRPKRPKKLLAGMLALALAMSMTTMSVSATELAQDAGDGSEVTAVPNIKIDETKNGQCSITIHKYAMDQSKSLPGGSGDGKEITLVPDADGNLLLPIEGKPKPLAGVTFEIYKVEDLDFLKELYSGAKRESPRENDYTDFTMPQIGYVFDEILGYPVQIETGEYSYTIKTAYASTKCGECTTEADGIAAFSGLDLGLYVVIETSRPAEVYKGSMPACFLVSLPMTVDGTEWLYQVHAYPKNDVTESDEAKLIKYGITEEGERLPLAGVKYDLQQKKEDGWVRIEEFTTDSEGLIKVKGLPEGNYRLIERDLGDNHGYIIDSSSRYLIDVERQGGAAATWIEAPLLQRLTHMDPNTGNYSEESKWYDDPDCAWGPGRALSVQASGAPIQDYRMAAVNEKPDITKEVQGSDDTWGKDAQYSVGDTIPYRVTASVPSKIVQMKTYNVTDIPYGLNDDTDTITVKTQEGATLSEGTHYSVDPIASTDDHGTGFKISFVNANMEDYAGKEIVISYEASLDPDKANTILHPANMGNPNVVELEYSTHTTPLADDPNPPDENETYIIQDKAVVYSFQFVIDKIGETDRTKLNGVQFDLYREAKTGETPVTPEQAAQAGLDTTKSWVQLNRAGVFGAGADGKLVTATESGTEGRKTVKGLVNGHYYLVETKTVDGYNLLSGPVDVEVSVDYRTEVTSNAVWTEGTGNTKWRLNKTTINITSASSLKSSEVKIYNRKGFNLPATGGMGTFVFTFAGISMMTAAVILLLTSKKKEAK